LPLLLPGVPMADFLSVLWTIVSFILGLAWAIVWFVLRDLLSTLVWIGIAVWIAFVLRHRSFRDGSLALLRYARYGAVYAWRWVRGRPGGVVPPPPVTETKVVREYRVRIPFGYVSASEQLNALLIALVIIMANV
jgi:membrane protein DedA with SNARE-associated domain